MKDHVTMTLETSYMYELLRQFSIIGALIMITVLGLLGFVIGKITIQRLGDRTSKRLGYTVISVFSIVAIGIISASITKYTVVNTEITQHADNITDRYGDISVARYSVDENRSRHAKELSDEQLINLVTPTEGIYHSVPVAIIDHQADTTYYDASFVIESQQDRVYNIELYVDEDSTDPADMPHIPLGIPQLSDGELLQHLKTFIEESNHPSDPDEIGIPHTTPENQE